MNDSTNMRTNTITFHSYELNPNENQTYVIAFSAGDWDLYQTNLDMEDPTPRILAHLEWWALKLPLEEFGMPPPSLTEGSFAWMSRSSTSTSRPLKNSKKKSPANASPVPNSPTK